MSYGTAMIIGTHPATNVGGHLARILRSDGGGTWSIATPTPTELDVRNLDAFEKWGWLGLDALVYAAGYCEPDWIWEAGPAVLADQVQVNLTGALLAIHHFVRVHAEPKRESWPEHLGEEPFRRIVLIGSAAADTPHRGQVAYNAAKAGLRAVVSTLAREIHSRGFRIFLVEPGAIDGTDYGARVAEGARRMGLHDRAGATRGTFGRNLEPREVAEFVAEIVNGRFDRLAGLPVPFSGGPQ